MGLFKDYSGQRFGRLTALRLSHRDGNRTFWHFRCDCGEEVVKVINNAQNGRTSSCGCRLAEGHESICLSCGSTFVSLAAKQKACSAACRFEYYRNKQGPNDCWVWSGPKRGGYGALWIDTAPGARRRSVLAHRYAYEVDCGPIPDGNLCVMHTCDNPPCTNPRHLRLGTWADNNRDRSVKGRSGARSYSEAERERYRCEMMGSRNRSAKLSERDVLSILKDTRRSGIVAAAYGVSRSTIKTIRNGVSWPHLPRGQ